MGKFGIPKRMHEIRKCDAEYRKRAVMYTAIKVEFKNSISSAALHMFLFLNLHPPFRSASSTENGSPGMWIGI